jgi:hypothetical protein
VSHTDAVEFCGFFAGGYLVALLLLLLASAVSERAERAATVAKRQWPLAFLAACLAAGVFFYGSHWDWSGCLLAPDGRHFVDGCPAEGWSRDRLQAVGRTSLVVMPALALVAWAASRSVERNTRGTGP